MKKAYRVFWHHDGLPINQDGWVGLVDTDDPVRVKQISLRLRL